jgi:hypothetical protein
MTAKIVYEIHMETISNYSFVDDMLREIIQAVNSCHSS